MRVLKFLLVVLMLFGSYRVYDRLTDDFRIANIRDELPFRSEYEVQPLQKNEQHQLQQILDQKFHYLGKGGQTYAFTSEDGRYVLKLFKFKHHRPRLLAKLLPPIGPLKEKKEKHFAKAEWKFHAPFKGYKLAYDTHRSESGLLFVHLNKTQDLFPTVTVTDKLGFKRRIDLDSIAFAIQEKGESFETVLSRQLDQNELEAARDTISKMYDLFALEYEKGLFDRDFCVMRNTGFVDGRAIRIDIGQLCPDAHERTHAEHMAIVQEKVAEFLSKQYPAHENAILSRKMAKNN